MPRRGEPTPATTSLVPFAAALLGIVLAIGACGPRARPVSDVRAGSAGPLSDAHGPAAVDEADDRAEADDDAEEDRDGEAEATSDLPEALDPCPEGMVVIEAGERRYCIDRYEASLVEVQADGSELPFPHYRPVDGHDVRAVSVPGVFPQGFISEVQARDACTASGKRLCTHAEWKTACMGQDATAFPYGDTRRPGVCHDRGRSAVVAVFGAKAVAASTPYTPSSIAQAPTSSTTARPRAGSPRRAVASAGKRPAHALRGRAAQTVKRQPQRHAGTKAAASQPAKTKAAKGASGKRRIVGKPSTRPTQVDPGVWAKLNEPALGQVEGALSRTGEHPECVNGYGVLDMVGNLHEWVATDPSLPHGTFAGGYYLDTSQNGDGCHYRTVAHARDYHDYSTGFRCCADTR